MAGGRGEGGRGGGVRGGGVRGGRARASCGDGVAVFWASRALRSKASGGRGGRGGGEAFLELGGAIVSGGDVDSFLVALSNLAVMEIGVGVGDLC